MIIIPIIKIAVDFFGKALLDDRQHRRHSYQTETIICPLNFVAYPKYFELIPFHKFGIGCLQHPETEIYFQGLPAGIVVVPHAHYGGKLQLENISLQPYVDEVSS